MPDDNTTRERLHLMALTAGPANIALLFGLTPRTAYRTAERLGVRIWRVGTKRLIPVEPFLAALEREAMKNESPTPAVRSDEDERAAIRAELGLVLRPGGRR
jgi:hypothetical protein